MDYEISAEYDASKNVWIIKVSGEIDIFNSDDFKDKVNAMIREKHAGVLIDCGGLRYIDSTGLGALVALHKSVKEFGGEMTLRTVGANMRRLLEITNLDNLFILEDRKNG